MRHLRFLYGRVAGAALFHLQPSNHVMDIIYREFKTVLFIRLYSLKESKKFYTFLSFFYYSIEFSIYNPHSNGFLLYILLYLFLSIWNINTYYTTILNHANNLNNPDGLNCSLNKLFFSYATCYWDQVRYPVDRSNKLLRLHLPHHCK